MYRILIAGVALALAGATAAHAEEKKNNPALGAATGRIVRQESLAHLAAGRHAWTWDGRGDNGALTPSGVYFIRLTTGRGSELRKVLRLVP